MLLARGHQAVWGHVGDSRLYFFRQGRILEQTKDHSVPQMLLAAGEITADEIRNHPDRNRLLANLGDGKPNRFRVRKQIQIASGDAFLLCTEGFWEIVLEREMEAAFASATPPSNGWKPWKSKAAGTVWERTTTTLQTSGCTDNHR